MRFVFHALSVAALLVSQGAALASSKVSTITQDVAVSRMSREGREIGCSLSFVAVQTDSASGTQRKVSGSLAYFAFPDRPPIFGLKLAIAGAADRFEKVSDVFLFDGEDVNSADFMKAITSDSEGYGLFMYQANAPTVKAAITMPLRDNRVRIAYHLEREDSQQFATIDLRVGKAVDNLSVAQQWQACLKVHRPAG